MGNIARIEVTRGTLTEYPIAEKVRGGWQNGVSFYPDDTVTRVLGRYIHSEPTDAQVEAAATTMMRRVTHVPFLELTDGPDSDYWRAQARAALEAARDAS
jgi:hypothetical protein